jgi:hypothetical protein
VIPCRLVRFYSREQLGSSGRSSNGAWSVSFETSKPPPKRAHARLSRLSCGMKASAMARKGRVGAESTSRSGEKGEFPKGCRHKRPHTLHHTALLWSYPDEVWRRTSLT